MDAMKHAIMKRRMKLAGDIDLEDMKDANKNPAEGSLDDLSITESEEEKGSDGLAPDIEEGSEPYGMGEIELEVESPNGKQGMDDKAKIESFFSQDDLGKPGIKGKAAARMMEALKKLRV